jgi:hypothetical protein
VAFKDFFLPNLKMVKLITQQHRFPHSWDKVTIAIWQKYPNPFASHVLTADVIDRYIDEEGRIYTKRLFTKKGKLPSWGEKLLRVPQAYILEESIVDGRTQQMITVTKNLSHSKLLLVEDTQRILPSEKETLVIQEVRIVSNTGFIPIRSRIEGWGLDRFRKNALNVNIIVM